MVFDAPTKDWAGRRNVPTIDVYLYDIREDLRRRERGLINEYDDRDQISGRRLPPRHFKLSYLVTAWTQRPEDEHRLLSALLSCFLRHDAIPPDLVTGPLAELGLPVPGDGRVAAARGPVVRRRLVGAGRRAQAVAGRRGQRPDRHRAAVSRRPAGRRARPGSRSAGSAVGRRGRRASRRTARRRSAGRGAAAGGRGTGGGRPAVLRCAAASGAAAPGTPREPPMPRRQASGQVRRDPGRTPDRAPAECPGRSSLAAGAGRARRLRRPTGAPGRARAAASRQRDNRRPDTRRRADRRPAAGRRRSRRPADGARAGSASVSDPSLRYLLRRVGLVEDRIRALVMHRRADDPAPDDPFRGLYLTEEVVDQLLARPQRPPSPDWAGPAGGGIRRRRRHLRPVRPSGSARWRPRPA